MTLYQIYEEDSSYNTEHLIYLDQQYADSPEEAVKMSALTKQGQEYVVVADSNHSVVE